MRRSHERCEAVARDIPTISSWMGAGRRRPGLAQDVSPEPWRYGWYNSAEARLVKSPDTDEMPPAMRTRPSSSGVAVKSSRADSMSPAGVKVPVAGLRSSAVATARSVVFRHAVR